MKKVVLSTLAYSVVTMVIAAPWHLVWFKDLYGSLGIYNRTHPIIPLGFLSMIIQGIVMAVIYPRYYKGGSHYKEAVKFSLLMGIFLFSISTMANAAKIEVASMTIWFGIQSVFHFIQFMAVGVALGFVNNMKK
jgi:hypothetical protein